MTARQTPEIDISRAVLSSRAAVPVPETRTAALHRRKDMTDITVVPVETPTLGDRSYVVHDGDVAFVVDPQRDIDRALRKLFGRA